MSVNVLTDISAPKPQVNCRCWDLIVDGDSTIHGDHTVDGNVTVDGSITINGTVDIPSGSLQISDLAPGPAGNFLVTDVSGTSVVWSTAPPITIPPGAPSSIFQTNSTGGATEWNTNLVVPGNATIVGDLGVGDEVTAVSVSATNTIISSGTMTSTGLLRSLGDLQIDNNAVIAFDCQCNTLTAGVASCTSVVTTGDILCGDDVVVTDNVDVGNTLTVTGPTFLVGNTVCSGDLSVTNVASTLLANGRLIVTGASAFSGVSNFTGDFKLSNASGASGAVVYKTGATTQAWTQLSTLVPPLVPSMRRNTFVVLNSATQNLNTGALVTLTWGAAFITSTTYTYGSVTYTAVSRTSSTDLTVATAGYYQIMWKVALTGAGVATSQIRSEVAINGSITGPRAFSSYAPSGFTSDSSGMYIANLAANDIITLTGIRNGAGTDTLATSIADTYICITLLSTLV